MQQSIIFMPMLFAMSFLIAVLSKRNPSFFLQQHSVKRAADMEEHVWHLTNASALLDSQEATARKVTYPFLVEGEKERNFKENRNSFYRIIVLWVDLRHYISVLDVAPQIVTF